MKYSLPKILFAMDLSDPSEMKNAKEILTQYPSLCIEDILQLLSKSMENEVIREFAVKQLDSNVNDVDLELYLLQLVQALRYEKSLYSLEDKEVIVKKKIQVVRQRIPETVETPEVASQTEDVTMEKPEVSTEVSAEVSAEVSTENGESVDVPNPIPEPIEEVVEEEVEETQIKTVVVPISPLLSLLIQRCSKKRSLASLFLHYIRVEGNSNAPNPKDHNQGKLLPPFSL